MRKLLFLLLISGLFIANAYGATVTWQGDDLTNPTYWNDADNWDTGTVPTAADDVVLTTANACLINATSVCRSLNASTYTGTLTHGAFKLSIGDATAGAGNVALAFNSTANMTYTITAVGTSLIDFISTSATVQTVNFNGHNTGNVNFNASSNGSWQLTGTWGTSATGNTTTLTKGTLDTNDQTCYWTTFSSSNSNTRALDLGASNIYLNSTADNAWNAGSTSGFTVTPGTSVINMTGSTGGWYGGGKVYNEVKFTGGGVTPINSLSVATWTVVGTAVKTDAFSLESNVIVTGTLNIDGNSAINRILIYSNTLGTPRTLTVTGATISGCSNVDFRDISFVSTGAVDFSAITGGSGDCGGNTISGGGALTFTTADDWYWNGSGTRNFSDYTYWYTATNGGGSQMGATLTPLPQDTCYFDADSIDGATTIDQDMPRIPGIDFTGVDAMAFEVNNLNQTIYGGLTLVSNVTFTVSSSYSITFEGRSAYNLDGQSKSFRGINVNMIGGSLTLLSKLASGSTGIITVNNGTFDANNNDIDLYGFNSSNSNARKILMGSGTWTMQNVSGTSWNMSTTNLDTSAGFSETSIINHLYTGSQEFSFGGGGLTYYNLTLAGGTNINIFTGSNTFNTFTINAPKTVKFTAGTTTKFRKLVASGKPNNMITIGSTTTAPFYLIDIDGGENIVRYCNISNSRASPIINNNFQAYTYNGNVDRGNNQGWKFYKSLAWSDLYIAGGAPPAVRRIMMIN